MDRQTLVAEMLGTALLLAVVVGSAEMASRLAPDAPALALLCNTLATGAGLVAILTALADTSASLNPAALLLEAWAGRLSVVVVAARAVAQTVGAVLGVVVAHAMFALPLLSVSTTLRAGGPMVLSEALATAGLLVVATRVGHHAPRSVPLVVAAWVVAGYWFTQSMCFANPAVTLARILTGTAAGIAPSSAAGFLVGEVVGVVLAAVILRLLPATPSSKTTTTKTTLDEVTR